MKHDPLAHLSPKARRALERAAGSLGQGEHRAPAAERGIEWGRPCPQ